MGGPRKMKKKKRAIQLISIILFILVLESWAFAQIEKKYPPYPDVWGYEFPWPEDDNRRSGIDVAGMPSGDYMITYVKHWIKVKRKDGSCCDSSGKFARILFFSEESQNLTENEYNEFWTKNRGNRLRENKIILRNKNMWEQISISTSARCPDPFYDYYIVKKDADGGIIEKKMLLYLYDKPQRSNIDRYCERNNTYKKDYILKKVENVYVKFVLLKDNTFLIYDTSGNFIIRFDENLNTKSVLMNKNIFLINRSNYEKIYEKQSKEGKINDQEINDAVANYLQSLRKEGIK